MSSRAGDPHPFLSYSVMFDCHLLILCLHFSYFSFLSPARSWYDLIPPKGSLDSAPKGFFVAIKRLKRVGAESERGKDSGPYGRTLCKNANDNVLWQLGTGSDHELRGLEKNHESVKRRRDISKSGGHKLRVLNSCKVAYRSVVLPHCMQTVYDEC